MSDKINFNRPVVLFDLDGTLLPMDNKEFEHTYFKGLCSYFKEFKPEDLIKFVWAGTKAMVKNNGERTNREAFAEVFSSLSGVDYFANEERFTEYYATKFHECRSVCKITDTGKNIVNTLKQKGYTVAIATNPIFPRIATYSRLEWIGLNPKDFPLVTTFENSCHAKPNPDYYLEVCQKLGVSPADCIMIGNDADEDGCTAGLGIQPILVKDYLINKSNKPLDSFCLASLEDILIWANNLPDNK